jgi:heme exporter protein D
MSAFLEMGGYADFVWPAYGFAAAVLVGLLVASLRSLRRAEKALTGIERPERRR